MASRHSRPVASAQRARARRDPRDDRSGRAAPARADCCRGQRRRPPGGRRRGHSDRCHRARRGLQGPPRGALPRLRRALQRRRPARQRVENYVADGPYQPDERAFIGAFVPPPGFQPRDDATYFPMPWLLSTRGYGVLVDNTETSYFRLAHRRADAWSVEVRARREPAAGRAARAQLRSSPAPTRPTSLRRFTAATGRQPGRPRRGTSAPGSSPPATTSSRSSRSCATPTRPLSVAQTYTPLPAVRRPAGPAPAQRARTAPLHAAGLAVTTYFNPMICTGYHAGLTARPAGRAR